MNHSRALLVSSLVAASIVLGVPRAFAHDERVTIEKESQDSVNAGQITVQFQLIDTQTNKILGIDDLEVMNEKKLHMIFFDPALIEFRHEHPTYVNGKWEVTTDLPVNGRYWMWAQGMLSSDHSDFSSDERLMVVGGQSANPTPPNLTDTRTGNDRGSQAALPSQTLKAKQLTMLNLTLSRTDGSSPDITPYLGSLAHVILTSADGEELVHVHGMSTGQPNVLMLHVEFPDAGFYRVWVQFIDGQVLRTVPLSVEVKP